MGQRSAGRAKQLKNEKIITKKISALFRQMLLNPMTKEEQSEKGASNSKINAMMTLPGCCTEENEDYSQSSRHNYCFPSCGQQTLRRSLF